MLPLTSNSPDFGGIKMTESEKEQLLENFMKEFFDFPSLVKAGIFKKEMKNDYKAQSERICEFLGLKTIYEYRSEEISGHLSYVKGKRPKGEPFVTVYPSIYE